MKKFEKCWMGKLWDQNDADNIQFKIWMEGLQMVSAFTLGLDMVLLSSMEDDGVRNAVASNKDWWSRCFIEINMSIPVARPRGRRVWVRIFGTPLHVWGEDCFNKVVWGFGKLIKLDEPTKSQQRLELGLIDLSLLGRQFTWVQPNGACMSRLDRILVSPNWLVEWGDVTLWALPRDISDHCHIILRYANFDLGPKPFRFNNHWLKSKGFGEVVVGGWGSITGGGWKGVIVKEKLKALKGTLKRWNREIFGGLEEKIEGLTKDVERLDLKREGGDFVENDNEAQKAIILELRHLLHSKDSMLFQRSRSRWLKEEDANTGYFHSCVASRKRSNAIGALRIVDGWVDKPVEVRGVVVEFFKKHFVDVNWRRPQLDGVEFPSLSPQQIEILVKPFSVDEVKCVVDDSDGNKSPGPDGFNFAFLKGAWEVVSGDVMAFMHEFHANAILPKALSFYFITLIPKNFNPQSLGDFRPISLLGFIYKIVAKVLTKRLCIVMDSLISKNQYAFLKGRLLVDRAYDLVSWSFLDCMLWRFGFDDKWRSWIRACVFAGSLLVLVNGSPTEQIDISKGLKQGDPLAPFLFILVAEGLGALLKKAVGLGYFKGVQISTSGATMSHLQYADDTFFVGEACDL
ncbi:LINE-1 reverse transcriptase like [Trifolium medium]|uniref:LINE-1 reverse transcriptase like n=1 Tax=Trifolium medium TaxID=97028 RepID=A0A392M0N3_9FABA|nr:LINE-1 reverse transcriptase like [Trifolium medium]